MATSVRTTGGSDVGWQPPPPNFNNLGSTIAGIDITDDDTVAVGLWGSAASNPTASDAVHYYLNSPNSEGKAAAIRAQRDELIYTYGKGSHQVVDFDEGVIAAVREKIGQVSDSGASSSSAASEPTDASFASGIRLGRPGASVIVENYKTDATLFTLNQGTILFPTGERYVLPSTADHGVEITLKDGMKLVYGIETPQELVDSNGEIDPSKIPSRRHFDDGTDYFDMPNGPDYGRMPDGTWFQVVFPSDAFTSAQAEAVRQAALSVS